MDGAVDKLAGKVRDLNSKNKIWLICLLIVNLMIFVVVTYLGLDGVPDVMKWIASNWEGLSTVGIGWPLITVINNQISPQLKAVLVFWKWPNPLPGHRVFSRYLNSDSRIDPKELREKIGDFPNDPLAQNQLWYRVYFRHQSDVRVLGAHKEFLLTRDLTWLSFAMFVLLGVGSFFLEETAVQTIDYLAILAL